MTRPGKPPPDPRSSQIGADESAGFASAKSWSESAICRVHSDGMLAREIKLVWDCQAKSRSTKRSSRADVSRETSNIASTSARSAEEGEPGMPSGWRFIAKVAPEWRYAQHPSHAQGARLSPASRA